MALRGPVNLTCMSFLLVLLGSSAIARASDIEEAMQYYDRGDYVHAAQRFHAAARWFDAAARNGRHVSRFLACAMLRGAMSPQVHKLNCFDWIDGFGKPGPR